MFVKVFFLFCIVAFVYVGVSDAAPKVKCQNLGYPSKNWGKCVTGQCPKGWHNVLWDIGCKKGQRCCI
ncbi:hypothetical protein Bhyg_01527 [Pseudolycoriella hygida]|uniref:Uncharacterized protein n=1 Tax=Pseudolycoriella hygida TaxID=35572 RepID=A0A9Q0N9K0_9DIPT|nr:hypothetical protein Bhyg_01527 [Pseudolycoriella hygida]